MKKNYLILAFIATVLVQIAVPVKMILDSEKTEKRGTVFRFKTVPIDPTDPFRGKYITLDYELASYTTTDTTFTAEEQVYVLLEQDKGGFARIESLLHEKPNGTSRYVIATISHSYGGRVHIDFPFDRFYMEESKAPDAEAAYAKYSGDRKAKPAYAVVAVLEGNAVVKDVIIEGTPIKDLIVKERRKPKN